VADRSIAIACAWPGENVERFRLRTVTPYAKMLLAESSTGRPPMSRCSTNLRGFICVLAWIGLFLTR